MTYWFLNILRHLPFVQQLGSGILLYIANSDECKFWFFYVLYRSTIVLPEIVAFFLILTMDGE